MSGPEDPYAEAALLTMRRNREQLLRVYQPAEAGTAQFPRSVTFRWLASHVTGRSVASTVVSALLFRPSWLRLLSHLAARRRRK